MNEVIISFPALLLFCFTAVYVLAIILFTLGLFFPKKGVNKRTYSVSVVIAARNEEKNIERILRDLIHQTYPKDKYEVIVVDDCSSDNTCDVVQKMSRDFHQIKLVQVRATAAKISPKKYALSLGIKKSAGEIIITTDADCRVRSTWIETMVSCFSPRVGMVIGFSQLGRQYEEHSPFEQIQALDFLALMTCAAGSSNLGHALAASGQNIAYRRCVFEQVGGFSKIGHRISGDDVLLLQLVRRHTRWRIRFAQSPRAFNASQPEKTLKDFIHQRTRWASNGAYQLEQNILFFTYVLSVFLFNVSLVSGVLLSIFIKSALVPTLIAFGAKTFFELLLLLRGAKIFGRFDLLRYFLLWTILEIPYVVVVGFIGTFGNFTWKGRTNSSELLNSNAKKNNNQNTNQKTQKK